MKDKCKIVNGKHIPCEGWGFVKKADICKAGVVIAEGTPSFSGLPTLNTCRIDYCFACGASLKEPIPERVDYKTCESARSNNLLLIQNAIDSVHARIDYILERLDNKAHEPLTDPMEIIEDIQERLVKGCHNCKHGRGKDGSLQWCPKDTFSDRCLDVAKWEAIA